jgi:hypothetical protein
VTMVLGSKLALAHLALASGVKPLTKSSLSRIQSPGKGRAGAPRHQEKSHCRTAGSGLTYPS